MVMMRPAGRLLAISIGIGIGCSNGPAPSPEVSGTFTVDGNPVPVIACRPGRSDHTFVEVITPSGVLRFDDQQLYWNADRRAVSRGAKLTCSKLDRSWGGGHRADGTSYWRGRLDFRCGTYEGNLVLNCGAITDEERAGLDRGRTDLLDDQRRTRDSGETAPSGLP